MTPGAAETGIGDTVGQRLRETNWIALVALGIVAFALGYLFTGLVVLAIGAVPSGGLYGIALTVGFTFYGAHSVEIGLSTGEQFHFFELVTDPAVPFVVYLAIPLVILVGAGVLATHRLSDRAIDPVQIVLHVVGIAIGYGVMATLGTFALVTQAADGSTASLVTSQAVLYGLLYPLIFSTIGATIESARRYVGPG